MLFYNLSIPLLPVMASLHKLNAAGVGLDSVWGKMIFSKFVKNMEWKEGKKLNLRWKKTKLWLWQDVGLGVRSQKVLREGKNRQMQRICTTVSECTMQKCTISVLKCLLVLWSFWFLLYASPCIYIMWHIVSWKCSHQILPNVIIRY